MICVELIVDLIKPFREKEDLTQEELQELSILLGMLQERILKIQNETLQEVLIQRYIYGKSLKDIAVTMNYSYDYIRELHSKAKKVFFEE